MAARWHRRGKATSALAFAALLPAAAAFPSGGFAAEAPAAADSAAPGAAPGDPARGRAIVANRQLSLCLLCHTGPVPEERFQGNLAPDLQGAGARWTADQLRARIMDASRFNPDTIMPAYYKTDGLHRVATAYKDKTILTAQQIEDVVAWLQTLKEPTP